LADGSLARGAHVLVSGGAGGIGAATCDALAAAGFTPVVGFRSQAGIATAVATRNQGVCVQLDLSSAASIDAAVAELELLPRLAGAVLAASPPPTLCGFGQISEAQLEEQLRVNVLGHQRLLAALVRRCFRKHKAGTVVGVLSAALADDTGKAGAGMGAYVIAKHGMAGVLALAAAEYPWLRVRSVKPGFTETDMLRAFDPRFLELQRQKAPFDSPHHVARLITRELVTA
jgi:3-oxoacyl-[acyl-carrier protein] reductase